jgi:hypothetical protein
MKAYKIEIVCLDFDNGELGDILYGLNSSDGVLTIIVSAKSTEIGEFEDDHPLNNDYESKQYIENAVWEPEEIGAT